MGLLLAVGLGGSTGVESAVYDFVFNQFGR